MRPLLTVLLFACATSAAPFATATALQNTPAPTGEATPQHLTPRVTPTAKPDANQPFIDAAIKMYGSRETAARVEILRGWKQIQQGDAEVAVQSFTQAYQLDRENPEVYWGLGVALTQQGKYDVAVRLFARALALDPQNPKLLADIGLAHARAAVGATQDPIERAKRLQGTMPWFDAAEKIDPGYPAIYANRATALFFLGNFNEAWVNIEKAEAIDRNSVDQQLIAKLSAKLPRPVSVAPAPTQGVPVVTTEAVTAPAKVEQLPLDSDEADAQPEVRQIVMPKIPRYVQEEQAAARAAVAPAFAPTPAPPPALASEPIPTPTSEPAPTPVAPSIPLPTEEVVNTPPATKPLKKDKSLRLINSQPKHPTGPDKRNCLDLPTNDAVMRCVYPR